MKKLAIMDMHQKAKSFTQEMVVMTWKRDLRLEVSTKLAHIQVETILHLKYVALMRHCQTFIPIYISIYELTSRLARVVDKTI